MKRYSEYKDSGAKWIGDIPKHWEVKKLRNLISMTSVKNHPNETLLSVVREQGVIVRDIEADDNHNFIPEDLSGYKLIEEGQFVINKMKAWQGSYAVSGYRGIVSPAHYTCDLRLAYKTFFNIAIRSCAYVPFFTQYSKGIRVGQWDLSPVGLKEIPFFLPPLAEQHAIVSYLDSKVGQIDTEVAKQTQQIELLKELKQAVIANAVTKGIDNKAKLKQTGISWIGHVPQHWERCRCKDVLTEIKLLVGNGEYALLSLTTNGVIVRDLSEGKGKFPKDFNAYKVVKPNDLVFCLFDVDETPRTVGLVHNHGMLTGAYNVFETKNVDTSFLYHYFIALDNRKALRPLYKGLRKVIPLPAFMSMPLYLPPLSEQRAIVSYIEAQTANIDKLIDAYEQQVERVKEYKQRLISDAVTGKINVTGKQTQTN